MRFIATIIEKLQRHPKRMVFPEGTEPRVLQAARQYHSLRLGAPILLGDRTKIKEAAAQWNVSLEGVRIINPEQSEELDMFIKRFELLRRVKGVQGKEAREAMLNPNFFGAMMLALHQADGFVSGANQSSGSVLRPLFQIVKVAPEATTASSCMVLEVEDTRFGHNGVLFMADCGVIPEPTVEQLSDIAVSTAQLARLLLGPARGSPCSLTRPKAAPLIRPSARCRPPPPWPNKKRARWIWTPISTGNCRWTRRWCRKSPCASSRKARWPGGPMC